MNESENPGSISARLHASGAMGDVGVGNVTSGNNSSVMQGEGILKGSFDDSFANCSIFLFSPQGIDSAGIFATLKEAQQLENFSDHLGHAFDNVGPVKNLSQTGTELVMQPHGGQNFAPETLATNTVKDLSFGSRGGG